MQNPPVFVRTGFDPSVPGTSDHLWRECIDEAHAWVPPRDALLVVSPHPDDEVLGAGGLIQSWARGGRPVTILSVTDGEAAFPDWPDLGAARRAELRDAIGLLGSHITIKRLGLPDGAVRDHGPSIRAAVDALVDRNTTLIAPFEHDGHPDHDMTGAVCLDVAATRGVPIARYPIWAWHHSHPRMFATARWGRFALNDSARAAKAAAAECFVSQLLPYRREPIVPDHVLTYFARPYEAFLL